MLANLMRTVFKGKPPPEVKVLSVIASRTEERSLSGVETFLRSVGAPEPFSPEIAGDAAGVSLLARCREGSYVKQQMGAHHRHALTSEVSPQDDPCTWPTASGPGPPSCGSRDRSACPCAPSRTTTCGSRARTP